MNYLILALVSTATGFLVGAWYAYAESQMSSWPGRRSSSNAIARAAQKIVLATLIMAGAILPFAASMTVPLRVAEYLAVKPASLGILSVVLSLSMVAVGNRVGRTRLLRERSGG